MGKERRSSASTASAPPRFLYPHLPGAGQPLSDRAAGSAGIGAQPRPRGTLDPALRRGDRTRGPGAGDRPRPCHRPFPRQRRRPASCAAGAEAGAEPRLAGPAPVPAGCRPARRRATPRSRAEGMAGIAEQILRRPPPPIPATTSPCRRLGARARDAPGSGGYARSCEALAAGSRRYRADRLPTLLVTGDEDAVGTPSGARAWPSAFPAPVSSYCRAAATGPRWSDRWNRPRP